MNPTLWQNVTTSYHEGGHLIVMVRHDVPFKHFVWNETGTAEAKPLPPTDTSNFGFYVSFLGRAASRPAEALSGVELPAGVNPYALDDAQNQEYIGGLYDDSLPAWSKRGVTPVSRDEFITEALAILRKEAAAFFASEATIEALEGVAKWVLELQHKRKYPAGVVREKVREIIQEAEAAKGPLPNLVYFNEFDHLVKQGEPKPI